MARILLVDDDSVLLKLYSTRLLKENHQIETANDGQDALKKVQAFKPELIVLDLLMPNMNGFTMLETLRKSPAFANTPVIIFSSIIKPEHVQRLQQLGITDVVDKISASPNQLVELIKSKLPKVAVQKQATAEQQNQTQAQQPQAQQPAKK